MSENAPAFSEKAAAPEGGLPPLSAGEDRSREARLAAPRESEGGIVRLGRADYDRIVRLWEASVRDTHRFVRPEDLAAIREELPVAYLPAVDLYGWESEGCLWGFLGVAASTVEMLFVHPDAFGRGVGKRLLHYAVRTLGARRVDVNRDNRRAREFYLRQGFRVSGTDAQDGQGRDYPVWHMRLDE